MIEQHLTMLPTPPDGMKRNLAAKYFVMAREEGERMLLRVVFEDKEYIYGYVDTSTAKNAEGKSWMLERKRLTNLLLRQAFERRWEVSLSGL